MKFTSAVGVISVILVVLLSGCSTFDRESTTTGYPSDYTTIRSTTELAIPESMTPIEIEDIWAIPPIENRAGAVFYPREAPRPAAIIGDANPDLVRIQNLGDRSWMVVQRTPETVWPVVQDWIRDSGIVVRHEDARQGILFSEQVSLSDVEAESLRALIVQDRQVYQLDDGADWLAVKLESGTRQGSTEVHIRFMTAENSDSIVSTDWPESSVSIDVERTILKDLANYDATGYVAPSVSIEATNISLQPKAEIVEDAEGFPLLILYVDFTRAWATVQKALENAEFDVIADDSRERYFDVQVAQEVLRDKKKNFFLRLVRLGNEAPNQYPGTVRISLESDEQDDDRYTLRLSNLEADATLSVEFARELLQILREHAP